MSIHLERALGKLKRKILSLGAVVEEDFRRAIEAHETRDMELARQVIEHDPEIDQMEIDVEEEGLKLLALHHPVAHDLRFIVSVLKINNDLERIGDLSVNIAERALYLSMHDPVRVGFDYRGMAAKVRSMLKGALDALVNRDVEQARKVCRADDDVDRFNAEMFDHVYRALRRPNPDVESLTHFLCGVRHLERIGDLATNIAEDVIYMVEGEIVRHKTEEYE